MKSSYLVMLAVIASACVLVQGQSSGNNTDVWQQNKLQENFAMMRGLLEGYYMGMYKMASYNLNAQCMGS